MVVASAVDLDLVVVVVGVTSVVVVVKLSDSSFSFVSRPDSVMGLREESLIRELILRDRLRVSASMSGISLG